MKHQEESRDERHLDRRGEDVPEAAGDSVVCAAGFAFDTTDGERIAGPLMSVLAVDRVG